MCLLCANTKKGDAYMENNTQNITKEKEIFYPTNDYCFKRLFGHKGNEKITQNLLEAILEEKCEVVEVKSDEVTEKDLASDKVGILDVFVKQKDGTQINIEMQMIQYNTIIKRILFYWAKKYLESIQRGENYNKLKPTKVILIANFEIDNLKGIEETSTSFKVLDQKTGKVILTEDLEIVIIEIPKMKKYKMENKKLESWLKFIENPNEMGGDILDKNEAMKRAKEVYDELMADEHEKSLIKLREKYMMDYNTLKDESYENGFKAGREAGETIGAKKEKLEIAKKMLTMEMSIEDIAKATDLSEDEIKGLMKK